MKIRNPIDLSKMDVCDFCFDEKYKQQRKSADVNKYIWTFNMNQKTLRVCNEHMNELLDCLQKLKQKGEI